jgi:PPOX class probable F420-dependent enzyme
VRKEFEMTTKLSDKTKKYLDDKSFANIATINKDGTPQVSPVWIERDGDQVIINSEKKRLKVKNVTRDPRVSISIQNPANPYEYVEIRGDVVEVTEKGGSEGIDRLAKKYLGQDKYPYHQPGDVRVIIKIDPKHVVGG